MNDEDSMYRAVKYATEFRQEMAVWALNCIDILKEGSRGVEVNSDILLFLAFGVQENIAELRAKADMTDPAVYAQWDVLAKTATMLDVTYRVLNQMPLGEI